MRQLKDGRQRAIGGHVVLGHPLRREPLLEPGADQAAIEPAELRHSDHRLFNVVNQKARQAAFEHLWDRAPAIGDHRVPQAIASIMTRPNGSGQSIGNRSARAPPRNAALSASPISPTY